MYHNDQHLVLDGYFEVDEAIPAIQVLNSKGYIAEWCCAGHPLYNWLKRSANVEYEKSSVLPDSYICFKEGVSLPMLPIGFSDESQGMDNRLLIRKRYINLKDYFEMVQNNNVEIDFFEI